jgi:hypothetical protein
VTPPTTETTTPPTHRRRHHRLVVALLWVGSVLAILAIAALIAGNIFLRRAAPMLKAKVVETLSTRFDSRVELDQFHAVFTGGFEVRGDGLKLYPNHLDGNEPMIAVDHFGFRIFDWHQLLHTPIIVNHVQVTGLSIHIPPKDQRANMPHLNSGSKPGVDESHGKIDILVRVIDVDHADLVNIDSSGDFGPFNAESPGDTPVDGTYSFTHADLNTIKGIGGMLASDGKYQGQLNHIVVDGKTTTPNFSLDIANRPVPLNTTFHAIVDGTNGNTYLQPVDAWLLHSHIIAQGEVVRVPGVQGRDIRLNVTVNPGHIEDMLLLAVKDQAPIMTGELQLNTKFDLPPGPNTVVNKLRLQGTFTLTNVHFTTDKIQSKVDELSLRGQGKAKQADQEGQAMKDKAKTKNGGSDQTQAQNRDQNQPQIPTADIASAMRGNFTFADSKITLPALNYRVPGADIAMQGVYNLHDQSLDFSGLARLDAHVSQMVTGWKSWLLKPVDPFFAKDGAGTQVPIKVGGTTSHPDIGLDFNHKDHDQKQPNAPATTSSAVGQRR